MINSGARFENISIKARGENTLRRIHDGVHEPQKMCSRVDKSTFEVLIHFIIN